MYHLGKCPICEQGLLGIRICGGCEVPLVICDECEALWEAADCTAAAAYPERPDAPCPICGLSLIKLPSHWATRDEAERSGWWEAVQGEHTAELDTEAETGEDKRRRDDAETDSEQQHLFRTRHGVVMKVLALEPYYGGSHQAFLDGWSARSQHDWTIIGLPAYKWKWRMRHAAITMAADVAARVADGQSWDALFCSDMLNLAEFLGLAPEPVRRLPAITYFHENQLTYPCAAEQDRDYHFAFTNLTTALAADYVWFNSAFHRDSFLNALRPFLGRMPDYQPLDVIDGIREKSQVQPPGIDSFSPRGTRAPGSLRVLWVARWEHDKDPQTFFEALTILQSQGVDFRLNVLGQSFASVPLVFAEARRQFADRIDRWGYQASREAYIEALCESDVVVSTARHEFFGIAVAEAVAAGAMPVVPRRLAYPELLDVENEPALEACFHDGTTEGLAAKLSIAATRINTDDRDRNVSQAVRRFDWNDRALQLDVELEAVV